MQISCALIGWYTLFDKMAVGRIYLKIFPVFSSNTTWGCLSFIRKQTKFSHFHVLSLKIFKKQAVLGNLGCTENDAH